MRKVHSLHFAVFSFLVATGTTHAQTEVFAGYVVSYQSPANAYEIIHAGKLAETGYYAKVFAGDVVRTKEPNVFVRLNFCDTTSVTVTTKNSPFVVPTPRRSLAPPIRNAMEELGRFLTREQEDEFTAIGRDGSSPDQSGPLALTIPGIADGTALVASGQRIFGVAWRGGVAPFSVVVRDSRGNEIIHEENIGDRELIKGSHKIDLNEGAFALSLRDASGAEASGRFTVVDSKKIPSPEIDTIPAFLDPAAKATMSAAWLLSDGQRDYWYEAYLEALPFTFGSDSSEDANLIDWSVRHPKS